MTESIEKRFWNKVNKHGPIVSPKLGHCWLWTGGAGAYGVFWLKGASIGAHVMAWLLHTGLRPIKFVLHKCDNSLCVRFTHLYEGTQRENIDDKVARNR